MKTIQFVSIRYGTKKFLFGLIEFIKQAHVLRTTKLPGNNGWESCLFTHRYYKKTESEVVERYETMEAAVDGHARHTAAYGLKNSTYEMSL